MILEAVEAFLRGGSQPIPRRLSIKGWAMAGRGLAQSTIAEAAPGVKGYLRGPQPKPCPLST
jgi:hypothetical protein